MLRAILNKSWQQHPTRHQLYGHLPPITKTIQVRRTRHAGHCWRSRDELIRDVLLWIPTHGRAKAGRPARTYIQQLCEDTGCCPEDLPRAMNDREEWRERVRDIRAASTIWWWWWCICQTPPFDQDATQGQFFRLEFNRFEFRLFLLVNRLPYQEKRVTLLLSQSWKGNRRIHTFPKGVCAIWNINSLFQVLNSGPLVPFLRWKPFTSPTLHYPLLYIYIYIYIYQWWLYAINVSQAHIFKKIYYIYNFWIGRILVSNSIKKNAINQIFVPVQVCTGDT